MEDINALKKFVENRLSIPFEDIALESEGKAENIWDFQIVDTKRNSQKIIEDSEEFEFIVKLLLSLKVRRIEYRMTFLGRVVTRIMKKIMTWREKRAKRKL